MSHFDAVWYGRAGAWTGGLLLLIMALSGRQVALVTVMAVIGLIVGVGLLLYAIPGGRVDNDALALTVAEHPPNASRDAGLTED